ncbi:e3 ubiquitin protein ligase rin2 [Quercus suber]|uniref:E3 ubiquitin protein ligase rin2 n=1 Tax=Quercus suber TaxID=58331 RepID=A0AAW0M392_QUESU
MGFRDNLKSDGLIAESNIHSENASRVIELLSGSYATIGLLTNFVLNVFVLLVLCLQMSSSTLLDHWPSKIISLVETKIQLT